MRKGCRLNECLSLLALGLALGLLAGCITRGDATRPIPVALVAAPQPARRLVVVLPGRGDDLAALEHNGVAQAIQSAWPDADVILAALTMPYYLKGVAAQRLHDEVIMPARRRHYRQVWLGGASLGGMGTLLYDRSYPGELTGMLLLAPYLGEPAIQQQVRDAGGLARWNPGPPQPIEPATWQHELWRYLKHWSDEPARTRQVWVAYGDDDRFGSAIELVRPQLPPGHVQVHPGGHSWKVWTPAMRELLQAASREPAR